MIIRCCFWAGVMLVMISCFADTSARPPAPPPEPTVIVDTAALQKALEYDHYFRNAMQNTNGCGAAVAIVKDSQVLLLKGYGLRNAATKEPVTPNTVFRIASLSKGFTGVLSGIMVQRGLLHWNDKVADAVPYFQLKDKAQTRRVTLSHVLSHTTGLPYHAYTNLVEAGYDLHTIIQDYFPKSPVSGKEGVFYAYQNAAFCLAGEMMRKATGQSFAEAIQGNIFTPAGMKSASVSYESMIQTSNKAVPHAWTGSGWVPQSVEKAYYNTAEAGGINASIADMSQWLKVLLGHRPDIVTESTLDQVFKPVVKTGNERRIQRNWVARDEVSYAMGWRVIEHDGDTIIYHGGYVNGFRGEIAFDRKKGIGVCVLFNGQTELNKECVERFFKTMEE